MSTTVKVLIALAVVFILLALLARQMLTTSLSKEALSQYAYSTLTLPDGMQVNYRIQGNEDGVNLLLIHGGGDSLDTWQPWADILGEHYRIVTVDLPGHGLTDPDPEKAYGRWLFARFIADFVDALELDQFVIGGNSYGGETALRYVIDNPGRAIAMLLVSSGGYLGEVPESEAEMMATLDSPLRPLFPYLMTREALADSLKEYYLESALTQEIVDRTFDLGRYEKNRYTFYEMVEFQAETYRDIEGVEKIDIPVLLLWGRHDRVCPPWMAERFNQEIADSELIIYENAGHIAMAENTEESARDAHEFLLSRGIGVAPVAEVPQQPIDT